LVSWSSSRASTYNVSWEIENCSCLIRTLSENMFYIIISLLLTVNTVVSDASRFAADIRPNAPSPSKSNNERKIKKIYSSGRGVRFRYNVVILSVRTCANHFRARAYELIELLFPAVSARLVIFFRFPLRLFCSTKFRILYTISIMHILNEITSTFNC